MRGANVQHSNAQGHSATGGCTASAAGLSGGPRRYQLVPVRASRLWITSLFTWTTWPRADRTTAPRAHVVSLTQRSRRLLQTGRNTTLQFSEVHPTLLGVARRATPSEDGAADGAADHTGRTCPRAAEREQRRRLRARQDRSRTPAGSSRAAPASGSRCSGARSTCVANLVAIAAIPAVWMLYRDDAGLSQLHAALATWGTLAAARGTFDLIAHRFIPWPSLFGADKSFLKEDTSLRRRIAFWRFVWRFTIGYLTLFGLFPYVLDVLRGDPANFVDSIVWGLNRVTTVGELLERADRGRPRAAAVHPPDQPHDRRDLHRADGADGRPPDEVVRAGRRQLGRRDRPRARPGGRQGRGPQDHRAVAGQRPVQAVGRQARARPALHRAARHRQDDARQGDRHRLQRALHGRARLGLRADVHRHGRRRRAVDGPQGQEARAQVGRPLHRLHRRDRRGRHAPRRARRRERASPCTPRCPCSARAARARPRATSSSSRASGATTSASRWPRPTARSSGAARSARSRAPWFRACSAAARAAARSTSCSS